MFSGVNYSRRLFAENIFIILGIIIYAYLNQAPEEIYQTGKVHLSL